MKRENNIIHTKENPIKDVNKKIYPIEKEDQEIMRLEKTCDILGIALKVEMVITLVVVTFAVVFNGFPNIADFQIDYKKASISTKSDYNTKI